MKIRPTVILFLSLLAPFQALAAQNCGGGQSETHSKEIQVEFRTDESDIDPTYRDNALRLEEITEHLAAIRRDKRIHILSIQFCGAASPEGSARLNRRLAERRLKSLESYVRFRMDIPDSLIVRNPSYIPWAWLRSQLDSSEIEYADEAVAIIDGWSLEGDGRIEELKALRGGSVWREMNVRYFRDMRNAYAVFVTYREDAAEREAPMASVDPLLARAESSAPALKRSAVPYVTPAPEPKPSDWTRRLCVKTNAIGWAMLIANASAEIDLGERWSFALPVYYSGINFFSREVKFRTVAVQPELRFWPVPESGLYVGAHLGMGYYNFALGGQWRYQDRDGRTPALGGGIGGGYRKAIWGSERLFLEISLGLGVYDARFDRFVDEPGGVFDSTFHKTVFRIDNAAVSFVYRFDFRRRER